MRIRLVSCGMAAAVLAGVLSFLHPPAYAQYGGKDKDLADVPKDPRYEADPEKKLFLLWVTDYFRSQLERTLAVLGIEAPDYM